MKLCAFCFVVAAFALPHLHASSLEGTWEGTLTVGTQQVYAGFDLDVDRNKITGGAFIQPWGYSKVFDGMVDGGKFRFVLLRNTGRGQAASVVELHGQVADKLMTLSISGQLSRETILRRVASQITDPVAVDALPKELEGKWIARFVGRLENRPKMIGQIVLDLRVEGNELTGVVHTSIWPGDCSISQGKVEHGRFSFVATGAIPSSSGIPILNFKGEIHGRRLKLVMRHQIFGGNNGVDIPLDATRPRLYASRPA